MTEKAHTSFFWLFVSESIWTSDGEICKQEPESSTSYLPNEPTKKAGDHRTTGQTPSVKPSADLTLGTEDFGFLFCIPVSLFSAAALESGADALPGLDALDSETRLVRADWSSFFFKGEAFALTLCGFAGTVSRVLHLSKSLSFSSLNGTADSVNKWKPKSG